MFTSVPRLWTMSAGAKERWKFVMVTVRMG